MHEFLSYSIFGIMTVKTYLIVAVVMAIFVGAVGKNKSGFKVVCKSLFWPYPALLLCGIILGSLVVGLISVYESVKRGRRK